MKFGSNQSKPEFTVDLKGATVEMASKDKSSKKNVFEVIRLFSKYNSHSFFFLIKILFIHERHTEAET